MLEVVWHLFKHTVSHMGCYIKFFDTNIGKVAKGAVDKLYAIHFVFSKKDFFICPFWINKMDVLCDQSL